MSLPGLFCLSQVELCKKESIGPGGNGLWPCLVFIVSDSVLTSLLPFGLGNTLCMGSTTLAIIGVTVFNLLVILSGA
jgi:hypothetical protein